MNTVGFRLRKETIEFIISFLGGFQPPGGNDNRAGYNPRMTYSSNGSRGGGGGSGGGGGGRFNNTALLTSTRVRSFAFSSCFIQISIFSFQVTLPNELVGAVIGPRGAKIQQIRQITSANIIIDDQAIPSGNGSGGGDRIITIEGTPEQISRAQTLLQQAVRQSGLWRP